MRQAEWTDQQTDRVTYNRIADHATRNYESYHFVHPMSSGKSVLNGGTTAAETDLANNEMEEERNIVSPNLSRRRLHKSYGLYRSVDSGGAKGAVGGVLKKYGNFVLITLDPYSSVIIHSFTPSTGR